MMSFVFAILAAVAIFQGADAQLQCYNCTLASYGGMRLGQSGCAEPFNSAGIKTIPCISHCVTSTTTTAATGGQPESDTILRTCYDAIAQPNVPCTNMDNFQPVQGTTISVTCCTGALCNGGRGPGDSPPATTPSSAGFLTFSAVLAVFAPLSALIF